jgi:hypothetical protein
VSQHEALIQDERIWFPVTGWHQTHLIAHAAFEAHPRNFSAEEKHFVENLLLFTGPDEHIAALTQRFCGRNILQRKPFAARPLNRAVHEHAGMEMQGNRALPVLFSNELDRLEKPFRVIEMAMRKDNGLDSTERQAHPASVAFDGIGIGARVEKDRALLSVCASGYQLSGSQRRSRK